MNTFYQWLIIEAEDQSSIKEVSKSENTTTKEKEPTVTPITRKVMNNNRFYGKVWSDAFVEFEQAKTTVNHSVTFNIRNVLSNIPYDIYLVTAPAVANDSNATEAERIPTKVKCTINYHDQSGQTKSEVLQQGVGTNPNVVDYILLNPNPNEGFVFPTATFGLTESEPQVTLDIETKVSSSELRTKKFQRTMRIDCIMLIPHGIANVNEERFEIEPHGDGDIYQWLKY